MKNVKFDFIRNSRYTVFVSIVVIVIGIVSFFSKGGLNLGIDFAGGKNIWVKVDKSLKTDAEKLRGIFTKKKIELRVNNIGDETKQEFLIYYQDKKVKNTKDKKTEAKKDKKVESKIIQIKKSLNQELGAGKWTILSESFIGPKIGEEFKKTAIYAAILILIILLVYIGFRFEFKFGIAAIFALLHDVLISLTFVSLLDFKFDTPLLAAILLIIGYSLNDTIVIFDRIREESHNLHLENKHDYLMVVNTSIIKSLTRTIMTSVTTLMVLLVLVFFGGVVLRPMAIILVVGVLAGTYSSNFIASPILVLWEKLFEKEKTSKKKKTKKTA